MLETRIARDPRIAITRDHRQRPRIAISSKALLRLNVATELDAEHRDCCQCPDALDSSARVMTFSSPATNSYLLFI